MTEEYKRETEKKTNRGVDAISTASQPNGQGDSSGSWITVLHVLLPLTALTLLWGRHGFITRFLLQFKQNCISALCPSPDRRPQLLEWVCDHLKYTRFWQINAAGGKAADYWKNGTLLCSLINSGIPGACSNPQTHWKQRPVHGQHLACKYLGVSPIFTEDDFKNDYIGRKEYQFVNYLVDVQRKVDKILQREISISSQYVARGMGLVTGEQFNKSTFYIYDNNSPLTSKSDVVVSITGPYGTHCGRTISTARVKKTTEQQRLAYVTKAQKMFFKSISIDFGYIINTNQNSIDNIPLKISTEEDRTKVVFIPQSVGIHQISIVSNGYHVVGSPFVANILPQSFCLHGPVDNDILVSNYVNTYKRTKKKLISKVIDCIDEQIILFSSYSRTDLESSSNALRSETENQNLIKLPLPVVTASTAIVNVQKDSNELIKQNNISRILTDISNANVLGDEVHLLSNENVLCHSDAYGEATLRRDQSLGYAENLGTSSICEEHIDDEVASKDMIPFKDIQCASIKRVLQRQCRIDVEEAILTRTRTTEDVTQQKIDTELEISMDSEIYNASNTHYIDTYLTEMELQPDIGIFSEHFGTPVPKARRSLPNILSASDSDSAFALSFETQFRERQDFWKSLSSHSLSCSSMDGANTNSNTAFEIPKYSYKAAKSLPNLYELSEVNLNRSNLKYEFEEDFYSRYEAEYFREKFLQCRDYWETISRRNLSTSTEIILENDFDSGYYSSLPNLSPDTKYENRMSKQFREKRQFWESLSIESSKWVQSQNKKINARKKTSNLDKIYPYKAFAKDDSTINEHEEAAIFKEEDETNLTDDLKEVNQIKFAQARNFFKNLEQIGIKIY